MGHIIDWLDLILCSGFSEALKKSCNGWFGLLQWGLELAPLQPPPPKRFKPKVGLTVLETYSGVTPDEEYWRCWPKNSQVVGKTRIRGYRLKEMALEASFSDTVTLGKVFADLTEGARIGCVGDFRRASYSSNAAMAYESGDRVSDAIAD